MKNKQIFWNALTTIAQVIGSAGILFLLYRFLVRSIGVERLGIWSLVLATTSMVTLANQGFSTSIVKFVAKYTAQAKRETIAVLIETAVLTIAAPLTILCLLLYPLAHWGLRVVLPAERVAEATSLLPYALLSLWFNILGSVLLAGLAGQQLITIRNYLVFAGSAIYLSLAFLWVPRYGLLGLAFAQIANTLTCFLVTWFLLRRTIPQLPVIPYHWDRKLFREMCGYGAHFQFVTFTQALREPVTKTLLAKFGGLAMTGFYDMASRWVFTFRELIVQANLVLVPTISSLKEIDAEAIPRIYRESYRLIFFLSVPTFSALVVFSPMVSRFWLGRYEAVFVQFVALLALGWLVNILSNPAYVVDLGTGSLRWVSIGCAVTGILNLALGYLAGRVWGGVAVVVFTVIALISGYAIVLIAYHIENRVSFRHLLPDDSSGILLASALGVMIFLPYFCSEHSGTNAAGGVTGFMMMAIIVIMILPMWRHPMRKRLVGWISSHLPARA